MVDVSFYMLVEEEGSFSLALYDSEKNVIGNYSNLRQNVVNDYIENLENEREFFISWDEKKSEYLSIDSTLLKYLLEHGNFVNSDFEKIEKILTNLVKEMINQELIEADKKEVKSNFKNAREYEIEQMLEKIEEDYSNYIRKSF